MSIPADMPPPHLTILSQLDHAVPTWLKVAFLGMLLLNWRNFPGVWHAQTFFPTLYWYLARFAFFQSRSKALRQPFFLSTQARTTDPLAVRSSRAFFTGVGTWDYEGHLSNSEHASAMTIARVKAELQFHGPFFAVGGWIPLGSIHLVFLKPIPAFSSYTIETRLVSFDHKWFHLVARFVSRPKGENGPEVVHALGFATSCFKIGRHTIPPAVVFAFCGYGKPTNWARAELLLDGKNARTKSRQWLKEGWKSEKDGVREEFEGEEGGQGGPEKWTKVKDLLIAEAGEVALSNGNGK